MGVGFEPELAIGVMAGRCMAFDALKRAYPPGSVVVAQVHAVRRGWTISAARHCRKGPDRATIVLGVVRPQPDGTPFGEYLETGEAEVRRMADQVSWAIEIDDTPGEFMMIGGVPFAHGEAEALRDVLCAILMPGIGGGIHSGSASPDGSATAAIYI